MAAERVSEHYATLTAPERFALMVEAMARRDGKEADRLEDSCPRFTYRCDDAHHLLDLVTRLPPPCVLLRTPTETGARK